MIKEQLGLVDSFKEQVIFEKEKDLALGSSELFYRKLKYEYKLKNRPIAFSNLYRKIINYQIDKYGTTISDSDCDYGKHTKEERLKISRNIAQRIRYRKNRDYESKRTK